MHRRVVVTGLGVVSPVGIGKENFFDALVNGVSGVDRISKFDPSEYASQIAGEVRNFNPEDFFPRVEAKKLDTFAQFALAAALMALEDSKLNLASENKTRIGVVIGTGIGGIETFEKQFNILTSKGPRRVSPFLVPMMIGNTAAAVVSIKLGLKGPNFDIVTACASGTHSIGEAFETIVRKEADIIFAGGTEAPITPLTVAGFCAMKALSTRNDEPQKASRPFDALRDGFIIGEGAGVLVLEELNHALERGAHIYAEIVGYSNGSDAYHITAPAPDGSGAAQVMSRAIERAGLQPQDIDYINAHGTSTLLNDKFETIAIKTVFGEHAQKLLISSNKSMTGHLLGAAGAVESVASVLTIQKGIVPPTINLEQPDPECDLNYVPNKAVTRTVNTVIKNSFGFGGHNACLVFSRYK